MFYIGKNSSNESKLSSCQSKYISSTDSLAYAFESQEYHGRVKDLCFRLCPFKVFGFNAHSYSGMPSSFPFYT